MENNFNDERLNKKIGFGFKYYLLIVGLVSIIYTIIKIIANINDIINPFLIETILIIAPLVIILLEKLLIKSEVKDEMYYYDVSNYYKKAFKIFVLIFLGSYSIYMPYVLIKQSQIFSGITMMNFCLFVFIFFMFVFMRFQKSYVNYNIIEQDDKVFYKKVFKNVLVILEIFSIMFVVSLLIGFIFAFINKYDFLTLLLAISLVYIISFISNAVYYILFSVFEKISYNKEIKETKKKLNSITLVICIIALSLGLIISIWNSIFILYNEEVIDFFKNYIFPNASNAQTIVYISNIINFFSTIYQMVYLIGIIYLFFDVVQKIDNNKVLKLLKVLFIVNLVFQFKGLFEIYCKSDFTYLYSQYLSKLPMDETTFLIEIRTCCNIGINVIYTMFNYIMLLSIILQYRKYLSNMIVILVSFCLTKLVWLLSIFGAIEPEVYYILSIIDSIIYFVFVILMFHKAQVNDNADDLTEEIENI